jgi:hypothetical protein
MMMPKMGELYRVVNEERKENLKKRYAEDSTYFSLFIEDESGEGEVTLLLTDKEVAKLSRVALPEIMYSHMVLGRCYTIMTGKRVSQLVRIKGETGDEYTVQMSQRLILKCIARAKAHEKSTPKKTWLQDMMD